MNEMLLSVAEVSNTFAVFTVLLALMVMIILIFRFHSGEMLQQLDLNRPPVPVSPMVMVPNPFVIKLQKLVEENGVSCSVSSQLPWYFQAFWGVNVADLHQILYSDWNIFKELFFSDGLLLGSYFHKNEIKHFPECTEEIINLSPPRSLEDELGSVPRTKYPLTVFMVKDDNEAGAEANTVAAMISIIHIKDSKCNLESGILMQYLKQSSGQVSCLKPLYVASDEEKTADSLKADDQEINEKSTEINLCVICQCEEITMALLPCRHTCVCADCFKQIDKCPMCRSFISTYFFIKDRAPIENSEQRENGDVKTKLEHYMRRLNSYLGFS